jgi:predicted MPP superfamily phosphohydrolase
VSAAPPPTDQLADYLKRLLPKPRGEALREEAKVAIHVRRFAGPSAYVERIAPVRIAHLTDLHVGRVTPMAVQRAAVALTNENKPDLVVITGDFVCHSLLYLDQLEEIVRGFEAPVIGVLGNHDHWSGAEEVTRALTRAGVEVLSNQNTTISLCHERLQVVGLDDAYTGHALLERAVKGLRADLPALGLSHIAEEADGLWRHGIPLVLSGHTHAGQVTVARMHEIAFGRITGHRYVHGLYGSRTGANADGAVYVGAGIGAAVVPLRLGDRAQREVAIFELGRAPGSFDEHHGEQTPLKGRTPSARVKARRAAAVVKKREERERKAARGR